jgi:hypothetical protein
LSIFIFGLVIFTMTTDRRRRPDVVNIDRWWPNPGTDVIAYTSSSPIMAIMAALTNGVATSGRECPHPYVGLNRRH